MTGLVLTQNSGRILGPIAKVLGWIIEVVFNFLDSIGNPNVGLAIILFTIIVYTLMIPLTYKQQKFTKMSARMNPEIQAIQKKYKGKSDNVSMVKMQDEMKAVYAKYGTSQTGSCLPLLIQMPVLFALYRVIYAIPAYISKIKAVYEPLVEGILNTEGGAEFIQGLKSAAQFRKQSFTEANTIIDVLNKATTEEWASITAEFPDLTRVIQNTREVLGEFNSFLGLNISNSPLNTIKESFSDGSYLLIVVALMIPIFAGLTQWLSIKLSSAATNTAASGQQNDMAQSMQTMNTMMPLMSVFFCFTLPTGLGLYWIMSAVVRTVQQVVINKYLDKVDVEEEIKKNIEKYNRKREKNGLPPERFNNVARTNAKNVDATKKEFDSEKYKKSLKDSTEYYSKGSAKPGSLASKARMVEQYNEKTTK